MTRVEIRGDDAVFLLALAHRLRTQDEMDSPRGPSHATSHPIYMVQQKERRYIDPDLEDPHGWDRYEDGGDDAGRGTPYVDEYRFVQGAVALTREGIEEYLRVNGHNLRSPRVYVASAYRVVQTIRLMQILRSIDAPAT